MSSSAESLKRSLHTTQRCGARCYRKPEYMKNMLTSFMVFAMVSSSVSPPYPPLKPLPTEDLSLSTRKNLLGSLSTRSSKGVTSDQSLNKTSKLSWALFNHRLSRSYRNRARLVDTATSKTTLSPCPYPHPFPTRLSIPSSTQIPFPQLGARSPSSHFLYTASLPDLNWQLKTSRKLIEQSLYTTRNGRQLSFDSTNSPSQSTPQYASDPGLQPGPMAKSGTQH